MTKSHQPPASTALTHVFDDSAKINPGIEAFLGVLIAENPETFWGLFDGESNAAEMETIVHQTIRGMIKTGKTYNGLALRADSGAGLVSNSSALHALEKSGYVLVNEAKDRITLTDRMLGKLLAYFDRSGQTTNLLVSRQGPAQPLLPK